MMDLHKFLFYSLRIFAACFIINYINSLVLAVPVISSELQATRYLRKYGYADESSTDLGSFTSRKAAQTAIKEFQKFAGLPETGELDQKTLDMMNMPRCGVKDVVGDTKSGRRKRFALQGSKWPLTDLTYKISKYPVRRLRNKREVDEEIARAFKVWSDVTNLNFIHIDKGRAHIDIRFEEGEHGYNDIFDGPGGELAHAFFPQFGGDVHFDEEETWTINRYHGYDLLQIAAHEFGHALGLFHSSVETALMKPFYDEDKTSFKLDLDDILGIQALYGEKEIEPSKEDPVPDLCQDASIDAATVTEDQRLYLFKGDYYWELIGIEHTRIADGYPRKISEDWGGLPGELDAALTLKNGSTIFFKRDEFWRFKNKQMESGYPQKISVGFPDIPNDIDAAFVWSGNGIPYIFKGSDYWRYYEPNEERSPVSYPQPINTWKGLPNNIDAAMKFVNNETYWFKGKVYYRFDDKREEVSLDDPAHPYPRPTKNWWFGDSCRS